MSLAGRELTAEQQAALTRLKGDLKVIKRNAARTGKTIETYLVDLKVDPEVAVLLSRKADDIGKYAASVNLERQDIPEEYKHLETDLAPSVPRAKQSWAETERKSAPLARDYKRASRALEKAKAGQALTAVEIDAVRQVNVNAIDRLKEIAETDTPEEFAKHYAAYKNDVFTALSAASSEAGRALNIHKRMVSVDRMARAFAKLGAGL